MRVSDVSRAVGVCPGRAVVGRSWWRANPDVRRAGDVTAPQGQLCAPVWGKACAGFVWRERVGSCWVGPPSVGLAGSFSLVSIHQGFVELNCKESSNWNYCCFVKDFTRKFKEHTSHEVAAIVKCDYPINKQTEILDNDPILCRWQHHCYLYDQYINIAFLIPYNGLLWCQKNLANLLKMNIGNFAY